MLIKNKICGKCGNSYDPTKERCPGCLSTNETFESLGIAKNIFWLPFYIELLFFVLGFSYGGRLLFSSIYYSFFESSEELFASFMTNFLTYATLAILMVGIAFVFDSKQFIKHLKNGKQYLFGLAFFGALIIGSLIIGRIAYVAGAQTNENQGIVKKFFESFPVLSFLMMGLFGPICEEFTYRIGLFSFLRRLNRIVAYIITIIVFALIHFSFKQETIVNELLNLPSYLFAGALLCFAYEFKGPMCSITAHCAYNIFSLLLLLIPEA